MSSLSYVDCYYSKLFNVTLAVNITKVTSWGISSYYWKPPFKLLTFLKCYVNIMRSVVFIFNAQCPTRWTMNNYLVYTKFTKWMLIYQNCTHICMGLFTDTFEEQKVKEATHDNYVHYLWGTKVLLRIKGYRKVAALYMISLMYNVINLVTKPKDRRFSFYHKAIWYEG